MENMFRGGGIFEVNRQKTQNVQNTQGTQTNEYSINLTPFSSSSAIDKLGLSCKFSISEAAYNSENFLSGFGSLWENGHNAQICIISVNNELIMLKIDVEESNMWEAKFCNADYCVNIGNHNDIRGGEGFDVLSAELVVTNIKNGSKLIKEGVIICSY